MEPIIAAISEVIFTILIVGVGYVLCNKDS
jgi:hypothetical protein